MITKICALTPFFLFQSLFLMRSISPSLVGLPSCLISDITSYLHLNEVIVGLFSTGLVFSHERQLARTEMRELLAKMVFTLMFDHEQDLLKFISHLDMISEGQLPMFRRLPVTLTRRPLSYVLRSILWTVIHESHPVQREVVFTSAEFTSSLMHTFRFNWVNTPAMAMFDEPSRFKIMTFLYSLHTYETELNLTFKYYLSCLMQNKPRLVPCLEVFLQAKRLIQFFVRFESVDQADETRTKDASLILAFHQDLLQVLMAIGNQVGRVDLRCDFFPHTVEKYLTPFCSKCILASEHQSPAPGAFAGTKRVWSYNCRGERDMTNRCALFPIHATRTFSTHETLLCHLDLPLSTDGDHFDQHDKVFGRHMCNATVPTQAWLPIGVEDPSALDAMLGYFVLAQFL